MSTVDWSQLDILIVEDSMTQLMLLKNILEAERITVHTAENGKEALEQVEKKTPTLIISDIEMPVMDGYELCKAIKSNPKTESIPVILLTNLRDPMDAIHGIECGADNFLTKPCKGEFILSSIADAVQNISRPRKGEHSSLCEFTFHGEKHEISVNHFQVIDLLLSTYNSAIEKNKELEESNRKLSELHIQLQNKNNELMKAVNEKNLILGMAAHDLRNPLNVIQVYSDVIPKQLDQKSDKKVFKMLSSIATSSKFMLQLVNDLLDVSVIDLGKLKLLLADHDLKELVCNNCSLNESLAEQKQLKIRFTCNEPIPLIQCDANKIDQVLNNLINNAIKYSNPGSEVEVILSPYEKGVKVEVRDHGVGM